ncbi:MAG: hypothetical protein ACRYG5_02365 [Janthinobacterium lividum]
MKPSTITTILLLSLAAAAPVYAATTSTAPPAGTSPRSSDNIAKDPGANPDNMPIKRPATHPTEDSMTHDHPASDAIAK